MTDLSSGSGIRPMSAYTLTVLHHGRPAATEIVQVGRAADVVEAMSGLLQKHPDCRQVRAEMDTRLLFAVDCRGEATD